MTGKSSGRGGRGGRPTGPSSSSSPRPSKAGGDAPNVAPTSGFRPKTGTGLSNASSSSYNPPPVEQPAQPPRNNQPNVPAPPPGPNQGVSSTVPSNVGGPTPAPNPFAGGSLLANTGIFSNSGIRPTQIEEYMGNEKMPETPTKTNSEEFAKLQELVSTASGDQDLLKKFQHRVNDANRNTSAEQRKEELRREVQPWIASGLDYKGTRRAPLYLDDGTRNPERPAKDAGGPHPPPPPHPAGTAPANPGATAAGNGTAHAGPVRPPASTKAPQPVSTGNKSSAGTGTKASTGTGNKSSTGTGNKASTGTGTSSSTGGANPSRPSKASNPTTGKGLLSGTRNKNSSVRKNQQTKKGTSPLSKAPMTAEDIEAAVETSTTTTAGRDQSDWESTDNLFEVRVMDQAGITWFTGGEPVVRMPTMPSSIDYNTENW